MATLVLLVIASVLVLANSLCILNHMTPTTSHLARVYYLATATAAFILLLVRPELGWWELWIWLGVAAFNLSYQPSFAKRKINWFHDTEHRRSV